MWNLLSLFPLNLDRFLRPLCILLCVSVVGLGIYSVSLKLALADAHTQIKEKTMSIATLTSTIQNTNANLLAQQKRIEQSLTTISALNAELGKLSSNKISGIRSAKTDGTCKGAMNLLRSGGK